MPQVGQNELIFSVFSAPTNLLKGLYDLFGGSADGFDSLMQTMSTVWLIYSIFALLLSALFIFGIIYAYLRFNQLLQIETQQLLDAEQAWQAMHGKSVKNRQWQEIQEHVDSDNPNDWKLAIIEADVMLGRLLETTGYVGATIGERLKSASASSFRTLDDAWRAHRLRNQIAHGGADFVLTQKMAREALVQYQRVFEEFGVV